MGLVAELRRRNVFRVAIAYVLVAWIILEAGDVLAPALHLPEWVVSALVFFLVLGFPLALIFAWAFELTPEGIRLEKHVDRSKSITHLTGRKLDYVIIGVLAVALVLFAFDEWVLEPSRDAELVQAASEAVADQASGPASDKMRRNAIAVLPFADLSPEGDQEYFSDGISEELLNVLSRVPGLRVTARTSSFQFKGENRDIIDIGQQLNVGYILEGSVRKSENLLRITAQLIDADDGFHLWSNTYDRELENVFAVQDEISAAIVAALKEQLGLQVEAAPRVIAAANTDAHDAYLRGKHLLFQRTAVSIGNAVREFERAIELDPDHAPAHAELAYAITALRRRAYGGLTTTEAIARAAPHAERAMALDPTLAEAHYVTGYLSLLQWNNEQALTHFRQALQINPNYAIAYHSMGYLVGAGFGRYDEGFAMTETALRLDPLSIPTYINYILGLIQRNRLDEADRELEELAAISPFHAAALRGYRMSRGGNWANSVLGVLDSMRIDPQRLYSWDMLGFQLAAIGLEKEALAISEGSSRYSTMRRHTDAVTAAEASVAEDPTNLRARSNLGRVLAGAGDYERARPFLEDVWERSGRRVTNEGLFIPDCAAALIAIRRDAGEEASVGELVAAIRDNVRRYREADITRGSWFWWHADYEEGLAAFLAGDSERGLALIAKAVEDGFFIMPSQAYLQALYDDPGFEPIRASQEARQKRERDRFLAIVCSDNPYADIWQPAEGTCEDFAASSVN